MSSVGAGGTRVRYTPQQRFEAAQWFIDIQETEAPQPDLLLRWSRWLEESDGNRLAFEAVERAWHGVPSPTHSTQRVTEAPYDGSVAVTEWLVRRTERPMRLWCSALIAASLVIAVAGWWFVRGAAEPRYSTGQFVTGTGEHMEVALTDGSRVSLGARSRLTVDFTGSERGLRLDSGEAYFEVSRDPRRPFNVHALHGVITAVGTAFNVRALENRVTVAVTEGTVSVHASETGGSVQGSSAAPLNDAQLSSGEQLTFTTRVASHSISKVERTRFDSAQATSWRDGWLMYRDEPLRYVIADVARYTDKHVAVSGSVDPRLRFTGAVHRDSVVEWLEALPEVFPVSIHAEGQEVIVAAP